MSGGVGQGMLVSEAEMDMPFFVPVLTSIYSKILCSPPDFLKL